MTSIVATLLLQTGETKNPLSAPFTGPFLAVGLGFAILFIVGGWKVFQKAGQPGWAVLIPIYNAYILLKIAGRPGWWLLLLFIPLVNIAIGVVVSIDVAKAFGQSALFGVILIFLLGGIGYLILGFGNYSYQGRALATGM
jgi:hypothetical protein